MTGRPKDPKTARNKNVLVIGGSGSGKTRFYVKPNLMQCFPTSDYPTSFVVTDPKGWEGDPDSLRSGILQGMVRFVALYQGEYDPDRLVKRLHTVHPMTLVNDEKSLSGTVSYKYMMLILRTYNGASRRFNLPIKQ